MIIFTPDKHIKVSDPNEIYDWIVAHSAATDLVDEDEEVFQAQGNLIVQDEPFPRNSYVKYRRMGQYHVLRCGLVLARLTRNGWYMVLDQEGTIEIVGSTYMDTIDE